jgi:putative flippase GtrA
MDLARIAKFAGVSGAGLCLDYAVYTALCVGGLDAGVANLVSASCGVTFVFVVSARRIFASSERFLLGLFVVYALYQVVAISLASWAVHGATALLAGRFLLGKTVILPFSFTANYLFMSWLFGARARRAPYTPPTVPQRAGSPDR